MTQVKKPTSLSATRVRQLRLWPLVSFFHVSLLLDGKAPKDASFRLFKHSLTIYVVNLTVSTARHNSFAIFAELASCKCVKFLFFLHFLHSYEICTLSFIFPHCQYSILPHEINFSNVNTEEKN